MQTIDYFFSRLLRFGILAGILYLIFTNPGTFFIIIGVLILLAFLFINKLKKELKKQQSTFSFKFNANDFNSQGFNFNNFNNNGTGGFNPYQSFAEVDKAKEFFGFDHDPTKEEIKKRYKELARKYHPDINDQDDSKMQELNHYKDILMKTVE